LEKSSFPIVASVILTYIVCLGKKLRVISKQGWYFINEQR
jgi:hypothetical protein